MQQKSGELRSLLGLGGGQWARRRFPDAPVPRPQGTDFRKPVQQLTRKQVEQMQLKYYNSDVHQAAFVLPEFARKVSHWQDPAGGPGAS